MGGAIGIITGQGYVPAAALPVSRIKSHESQVSIGHPFKEGYSLVLKIHILGISQIVSLVNGDRITGYIGHVLIVVGIVGLSLDADFSKKFFPFLFRSFRHFVLYVGHIIIAAGKRSKEDAVHVEIGAGLDAYTKDKAYCQLSKFLIHPVLLISQ